MVRLQVACMRLACLPRCLHVQAGLNAGSPAFTKTMVFLLQARHWIANHLHFPDETTVQASVLLLPAARAGAARSRSAGPAERVW